MAYVVLVINCPDETIQDLNDSCQFPTKVPEAIQGSINLLTAITAGSVSASIQVTTRDSAPSISTSGSGSEQYSYNHL